MPAYNSAAYTGMLVVWLLNYLRTHDEAQAAAASGLGRTAKSIIIRRLKQHGTLTPRPAPGRPIKYTPDVCQLALDILEEHDGQQLNLTQLLAKVEEKAALAKPTDVDTFSRHLRAYVHAQGRFICTTSTSTTFMLARSDLRPRVEFCKEALEALKQHPLEDIWFVDETAWEQCPPPKGVRRRARASAAVGAVGPSMKQPFKS
jgi:hypothetical protein